MVYIYIYIYTYTYIHIYAYPYLALFIEAPRDDAESDRRDLSGL